MQAYYMCMCYFETDHTGKPYFGHKFWQEVESQFDRLVRQCPGFEAGPNVQNVKEYALRWVDCFETYGHVQDDPLHHRGMRPRMPDDVARQLVIVLLNGYEEEVTKLRRGCMVTYTKHKWFRSIHDAVTRSEVIRKALHDYNIQEHVFLLRLRNVAPWLKRRHFHPRMAVTREVRDLRIEQCELWLSMGDKELLRYLCRVLWIDSKTFYIQPKSRFVYAPADADMAVEDERLTGDEDLKIVYYIVVNAVLGPVYIEYVTGTSSHTEDPFYFPYYVSPCPLPHSTSVVAAAARR